MTDFLWDAIGPGPLARIRDGHVRDCRTDGRLLGRVVDGRLVGLGGEDLGALERVEYFRQPE